MMGIEVLDQDERHAGVVRKMREQVLIGFETARRCADADDRKRAVAVIGIGDRAFVVHLRHRKCRLRIVRITRGQNPAPSARREC